MGSICQHNHQPIIPTLCHSIVGIHKSLARFHSTFFFVGDTISSQILVVASEKVSEVAYMLPTAANPGVPS
jgi:hypothetical protein